MADGLSHTRPSTGLDALYAALSQKTIAGLDGLRAIAVLSVVVYHAGRERVNGSQGVLVFFTLSGFLITWLLLGEGEVSLRKFYARRALRLFPAFYAYWLGMVALLLVTRRDVPWGSALSAFFYSVNYYNATHGHPASFVSHGWSLAVEEQFYLLWPLAFVVLGRDRARLTHLLVVAIGLAWVHRTVLFFAGAPDAWLYNAFDCRVDHLLVGCLGAVLLRTRSLPRLFDFVARSRALAAAITCFLLAIGWFELELGRAFLFVVAHAVEPPLVMLLMVWIVANATRRSQRWLVSAPLRHVGKVSYGVYLFHPALTTPIRARAAFLPEALQMVAVVAGAVAVATASYFLFERPFLALKDRFRAVHHEPR